MRFVRLRTVITPITRSFIKDSKLSARAQKLCDQVFEMP